MIAIIDYGAGNLRSVAKAVARLGRDPFVTYDSEQILAAEGVILPGVGAAADTMESLRRLDLLQTIIEVIDQGTPFLGICMGLQVLLTASEEGGYHRCLDVVPGIVRHLPHGLKVPHMGWNQVRHKTTHPLFAGIPDEVNFYFVHSYYADPVDKVVIAGETDYGCSFASVIIRENVIGTQFHPEKSGRHGLKMLSNFLNLVYAQC